MYIHETQTPSTALCGNTLHQLSTKLVNKYRKYG